MLCQTAHRNRNRRVPEPERTRARPSRRREKIKARDVMMDAGSEARPGLSPGPATPPDFRVAWARDGAGYGRRCITSLYQYDCAHHQVSGRGERG